MIQWTEDELREMAAADAAIEAEETDPSINVEGILNPKAEEARLRKNRKQRERYANDAAFRERQLQNYKKWKASDPERIKAARRESSRQYRRRQKMKRGDRH